MDLSKEEIAGIIGSQHEQDQDDDVTDVIKKLVKSLPESQQIEVFEIAQALKIQPGDDLIYLLLVGLGYHKTLLCGVPDKISEAAISSGKNIIGSLKETEVSFKTTASIATDEFKMAVAGGATQVEIAARNGAKKAIETADLSIILENIRSAVEDQSSRKWFKQAFFVAAVVAMFILFSGIMTGYFLTLKLTPDVPQEYKSAMALKNQLVCTAFQKTDFFQCKDKQGNFVLIR